MPRDRYVVRPTSQQQATTDVQLALFPLAPKLRRVWFPYTEWEEFHAGMWRTIGASDEHDRLLRLMVQFTGDAPLYGISMRQVVHTWPISCALNLTTTGMNRHAWIGHAACALRHRAPEHIVREAWHLLTQQQQDAANEQAEQAIRLWEDTYGARYQ